MSKMRIHELAKELSLDSKALVLKAGELGFEVKSHMSTLEEEQVEALRTATLPAEVSEQAPAETVTETEAKAKAEAAPAEEEDDSEAAMMNRPRKQPQPRRGRNSALSENDPFWQFGTPVESWGSSRGGGDNSGRDPSGLAPDDPYWQFGSPPETWGSTRKKGDNTAQGRHNRPRAYIECQRCGVKIERKAAHRGKKVPCPFCNRWMREVK
jgi:hypothetical protein